MHSVRQALNRTPAATAGAALALAAAFSSAPAAADDIVYLEGISASTETSPAQTALGQLSPQEQEDFCSDDNIARLQQQVTDLAEQVSDQLGNFDAGLQADFNDALAPEVGVPIRPVIDRACETPAVRLQTVNIIYSTCRMTMRDSSGMIDVRFPPGTGDGYLTFLDPATLQATVMPYQSAGDAPQSANFARLMNQESGAVQGYDGGSGLQALGTEEESQIVISGRNVAVDGQQHSFEFTFELNIVRSMAGMSQLFGGAGDSGGPGADEMEALMAMMPTPRIRSEGTALIAPNVPGLDIIRTFYQTFASAMGAEGTYLAGLFNHEIMAAGFPLRIEQTTEMQMDTGGLFGGLAGAMGGGEKSESLMEITRIVGPISGSSDFCSQSIVPPNYTISDPFTDGGAASDAQNSAPDAAGSSGSGAAGGSVPGVAGNATMPSSDEIAAALAEANAAIEGMSEEDRAALQRFAGGFGQLLGGALSGQGVPGATPGGAAAAAPGGASAGSAAPARARPESSELMTDDLTQSVQNMLQALGYDPGNTTGEASIQTTIAISQFQAEKGLEVTGEVSPQLVGILAAEVDSR